MTTSVAVAVCLSFALEYVSDPQISPSADKIVYVRNAMDRQTDRQKSALWLYDVAQERHTPLITQGASNRNPRWSGSGDRLLFMHKGASGSEIRVLYLDSGKEFTVTQLDRPPSAGVWSPDDNQIAFTMLVPDEVPSFAPVIKAPKGATWAAPVKVIEEIRFRFDGAGYLEKGNRHVFVVSSEGGAARQISEGDADYLSQIDWLDNDHVLASGSEAPDRQLNASESDIFSFNVNTGERRQITQRNGPDRFPSVSPDGSKIAYLGYDEHLMAYQQTDIYVMGRDGEAPRNLTADFDRTLSNIAWRADGKAVLAMVQDKGALRVVEFPLNGAPKALFAGVGGTQISRPYGSGSFSIASTRGRPVIAYTHANLDSPADLGLFRKGRAQAVVQLNDGTLPYLDLADMEPFTTQSSVDGRDIDAWIALPPGFERNASYPLILEIHGGPFAMYGPYFSSEIQRYAAAGYVVVWSNPRGSTGYGEEFAQLINDAYPGDDYHDLMSVVDHVVAQGYVDKERLFVTGGSGGGILTAWIVGKTDRFVAAAAIKPIINWTTAALIGDIGPRISRNWIKALPWEDPERYWRTSPLSLVGNMTTPTMVMVGEADWRTPTWEAEQLYGALKLKGVDTALVRVPGASHFISARPSRIIAKTENIMGWFARYDKKAQTGDDDE